MARLYKQGLRRIPNKSDYGSIRLSNARAYFNPIQDGHFQGCSRMGGAKRPPSLKSVTHILK